mgnify:CR=1 FL=1
MQEWGASDVFGTYQSIYLPHFQLINWQILQVKHQILQRKLFPAVVSFLLTENKQSSIENTVRIRLKVAKSRQERAKLISKDMVLSGSYTITLGRDI